MKRLKQLWARHERARWEADAAWFRLRYREPDGPVQAIRQLSRVSGCGRVALAYRPGEVSQLHIAVPQAVAWLLRQMAEDYGFGLTPERPAPGSKGQLLAAAGALPWERPFVAHVVAGHLLVAGGSGSVGSDNSRPDDPAWRFPQQPPVGLRLEGCWPAASPPPALVANSAGERRWPLGWGRAGGRLSARGRLNVYGSAAADWLAPQLVQTIAADHSGLVILDGRGDLVPRLKRQATVTRLLGKGLSYVNLGGDALMSGYDPLAAVPGETETARRRRRTAWFRLMGVHNAGLDLLAVAPLTDLAGLQKWLGAPAQQRQGLAAVALEAALTRLQRDRSLRQWLAWPVNCFAGLPDGALLLAGRTGDSSQPGAWARQQLLLAAWLAVREQPGIRLVLHGLPWRRLGAELAPDRLPAQTVIGNGPPLAGALTVLTACPPDRVGDLAARFLRGDPVLAESLYLLPPGAGVVCHPDGIAPVSWRPPQPIHSKQITTEGKPS